MACDRPDLGPLERGMILGFMLAQGESLTSKGIQEQFGVSRATAKRDLLVAETTLRAEREEAENGAAVVRLRRPTATTPKE